MSYLGGMYTGDRGAYRVVLSMEKTGDQLVFRNEGTDPQVGSSNCSYGAWRAAVLASLCSMLAWDHRFCFGGVLEHLKFEGTARHHHLHRPQRRGVQSAGHHDDYLPGLQGRLQDDGRAIRS